MAGASATAVLTFLAFLPEPGEPVIAGLDLITTAAQAAHPAVMGLYSTGYGGVVGGMAGVAVTQQTCGQ
jgi:hypothetical protein